MKKFYRAKVIGVLSPRGRQTSNGRDIVPVHDLVHLIITNSEKYRNNVFEKCYPMGTIKYGEEVTVSAEEIERASKETLPKEYTDG